MTRAYFPYIIGSESPIPHLFESILPEMSDNFKKINTFTQNKIGVLDDSKINEHYVGDITSLRGAVRFNLKYPIVSLQAFDLIHTGGRPQRHYRISKLSHKRNRNLAHVHTLRIDVDPDLPSHTYRKKLVEQANKVTAVSKHTAQTAEDNLGVEPHVVYNGVSTKLFDPDYNEPEIISKIDNNKKIFLFVGSLVNRKNPQDFIEVAKDFPESVFIMIGGGEKLQEMRKKSEKIDNVLVLGRIPKQRLPPIYANADGLVFPSVSEGCPNVVLEAMASSLPVVGYRATSIPELVKHKKTGYLADSGDTSELSEGVDFIIDSDDKLGEKARTYVKENHSFQQVAKEYCQIYGDLV